MYVVQCSLQFHAICRFNFLAFSAQQPDSNPICHNSSLHACSRARTYFAYKFIYFTSSINLYGWLGRQQTSDSRRHAGDHSSAVIITLGWVINFKYISCQLLNLFTNCVACQMANERKRFVRGISRVRQFHLIISSAVLLK